MIAYLSDVRGLGPQDAYGLCSVAADLMIGEVVDLPNFVVSPFMPKDVFEAERSIGNCGGNDRAAGTRHA